MFITLKQPGFAQATCYSSSTSESNWSAGILSYLALCVHTPSVSSHRPPGQVTTARAGWLTFGCVNAQRWMVAGLTTGAVCGSQCYKAWPPLQRADTGKLFSPFPVGRCWCFVGMPARETLLKHLKGAHFLNLRRERAPGISSFSFLVG